MSLSQYFNCEGVCIPPTPPIEIFDINPLPLISSKQVSPAHTHHDGHTSEKQPHVKDARAPIHQPISIQSIPNRQRIPKAVFLEMYKVVPKERINSQKQSGGPIRWRGGTQATLGWDKEGILGIAGEGSWLRAVLFGRQSSYCKRNARNLYYIHSKEIKWIATIRTYIPPVLISHLSFLAFQQSSHLPLPSVKHRPHPITSAPSKSPISTPA